MVLRDKVQPPNCFDNPLYDTEGAARPNPDLKLDLQEPQDSDQSQESQDSPPDSPPRPKPPPDLEVVQPRAVRALKVAEGGQKSWNEGLRLELYRNSTRSTSSLASPNSPKAHTTDINFEDNIIENIRNREFWKRRSRCSSVRISVPLSPQRTRGAPHTTSLASGNILDVPFKFPINEAEEEKEEDKKDEEEKVEEEEEDVDDMEPSDFALEIRRERQLRENITWLRTNLKEVSEAKGGTFTLESFLSTMKNKELLKRLFSLWDAEGCGLLQQKEWIEDLKSNAREAGAREWAELLEVLAYIVCGEDGEVNEDLFTTILTSRGVLEKLFRLVNKDGDGFVSRQEIMDFIANLTYARPRTGFTRENLEWLEQLFRQALGRKNELSFDDFKKIVHSRNSFFAERVFQIFDRDNSGTVSLSEFLDAMHQFAGKSPNDKIKFLFKVYDLDGDGLIQQSELQKVMKACMEENGMRFSSEQIEDLTLALFEDADTQRMGAITYESLKAQLEKHDGLLENLSISIDRWLVPPNMRVPEKESLVKRIAKLRPYQMSLPYLKNNYVYLSFLVAYMAINVGLFISRAHEYWEHNTYTIIARACGQCLNFNCMFVLVVMLRQCITYLRSLGAGAFLPLDQHMYLHKLCGGVIFILSLVHTLAHLLNFSTVVIYLTEDGELNEDKWTLTQWLLTTSPGKFGLVNGVANPTGVALIIILTLMVLCSLPFVRKSGYFEVFYWTHLLYVVFWLLTVLHGPNFWKWFVAPGVIFLIERVHRTIRMRTGHGKTYISSGVLLPSKVIHLVIQRPGNFHFCPGDYVFINIPAIAKYEWHPFTISSAPEQEDAIWVHIRAVGEWTNRLYAYFEREQQRCEKQRCDLTGTGTSSLAITMAEPHETDGANDRFSVELRRPRAETSQPASDIAGSSTRQGENGYTNVAFESEMNGSAGTPSTASSPPAKSYQLLANHKNQSAPSLVHNDVQGKRVLIKSRSVPDFNRKIKKRTGRKHNVLSNFRPLSEQKFNKRALDKAKNMVEDEVNEKMSRRVLARSFRYMRHKPTIITVDLPSESEEEEEEEAEGEAEDTTQGTTMYTVEEGRVSHTPTHEEQRQIRRSRQEERRVRRKSRLEEALAEGGCAIVKPLVIYVDGSFGAPSSHIFRAQHAVLIGTGIGVTPFASILQSIMHKYWKARRTCPKCQHSWATDIPHAVMNLRKVDFFWINRDQRSFEWFVNLLSQLEIEQAEQGGVMERFLDMHMYITSALQKTDMKAVGLQLALDLLHEKEKRDLITGLKTRTNAGRPNWDKVFKQLKNQQKGKITVFYCGPPALARTLRYKCDEYGFDFRKEIF